VNDTEDEPVHEPYTGEEPPDEPRRGGTLSRGRLLVAVVGVAVLVGAVVTLRSGVDAPPPPAIGPDGQQIRAYHDARFVVPPVRPSSPPTAPGELRFDARTNGTLVSWPAAPYGFEVRWGRAGGAIDQVRYVATAGTSLIHLDAGRYRVEVRSVDDIGQRSEPTAAEIDISADAPEWQRGYGFLEDFTQGAQLDADRWILATENQGCISRDGRTGPIMITGRCFSLLRPSSKLVFSEPDDDGVRGRVVVVADAPSPPRQSPQPDTSDVDSPGANNEFMVIVGPTDYYGGDSVVLRIGTGKSYLSSGFEPGIERERITELAQDGSSGPGAMHRWELVFTEDEVRAVRNGEQVGAMSFRPPWRESSVALASFVIEESNPPRGARIGLLGLTGPAPDGRPTEVIRTEPRGGGPGTAAAEHRIPIDAVPTAETVRLTGFVGTVFDGTAPEPPPAPTITAEYGGRPLTLRKLDFGGGSDSGGYMFEAEVAVDTVRAGGELVLRSADGTAFETYEVLLQIDHARGTELHDFSVHVDEHPGPRLAEPELTVRQNGKKVSSGQRVRPGEVEVEVDARSVLAQGAGGIAGWVTLRVDLDGKRILDHPTALTGPAVAGRYRFLLKTGPLKNRSATLSVSLVPDRPGVAQTSEKFTVRVVE